MRHQAPSSPQSRALHPMCRNADVPKGVVQDQIFHCNENHCAYANATFLSDKIMLIATSIKPISNKMVKQVLFLPVKILFMKSFPPL